MHYWHLTLKERERLFLLLERWWKVPQIAKDLQRHHWTLYREIERNSVQLWAWRPSKQTKKHYLPDRAQLKSETRKTQPKNNAKLKNLALRYLIIDLLKNWRSPNVIAWRIKLISEGKILISHETIYKFIYSKEGRKLALYKHLLRKHKRRKRKIDRWWKKKEIIQNRVDISERPQIIDDRLRLWDWEWDTVISKGRKTGIVTLLDRKGRRILSKPFYSKKSKNICDIIIELLSKEWIPVKSLTLDNGTEFAKHSNITRELKIPVYFAKPYHSRERGSNENANGIIRRFYPKGTDFAEVDPKKFAKVIDFINNTPRESLDFKTPLEVLK